MDSAVKWENVNIFTVLSNGLATLIKSFWEISLESSSTTLG